MKIKSITLIASLALLPLSVHADGISSLQHFNENIKHFSGNFTQTVKNTKKTQKTSGSFAIARPEHFRWIYEKPYQQTIIGDGKTLWLYDVDLAQVTKRNQKNAMGNSPAAILSHKNALSAHYTIQNDGEENGIAYVVAEPKNKDSEYKHIRIGFRDNVPENMHLQDSFGNTTDISFSQVKINPNLSGSLFQFKPPKGVDVLDANQ